MGRKKTIAVIRLHSDELEKFWHGLGGFHLDPEYFSETQERDESKDVRVYLHGGIAENCPKYRSQTTSTRSLTRLENRFHTTNLGLTGALNAKSRRTKKFKEHGKYVPRKRKTCNKQKVEQFLTLISVSSRCTS